MQLKRKGISPNGVVAVISLATGKTIKQRLGNVYMQIIEYEKPLRGWVWYHECSDCEPVESSPGVDSPAISELDLCVKCKERELLIATRQACRTKTNDEYAAQYRTGMDDLAKNLQAVFAATGVMPDASMAQLTKATPAAKTKFKTRVRNASEFKNGEADPVD